jgi:hypothetical protein
MAEQKSKGLGRWWPRAGRQPPMERRDGMRLPRGGENKESRGGENNGSRSGNEFKESRTSAVLVPFGAG